MRTLAIAIAFAALTTSAANARPASAGQAWCAYYDPWTYNCGFVTFQQCLATVSGAGGLCKPNPYGPSVAEVQPRRPRKTPRY